MKKSIIILFALISLFLIGWIFIFDNMQPIKQISTNELMEKLQQRENDTVFIDVREPYEYGAEHINGMINIPLSSLAKKYTQIPKNQEIVIMCRTGNRSMQASSFLVEKGYGRIVNVEKGISDWKGSTIIGK